MNGASPDEAGSVDSSLPFGVLEEVRVLGDRQALLGAGRRVMRLRLGSDVPDGLAQLGGCGA